MRQRGLETPGLKSDVVRVAVVHVILLGLAVRVVQDVLSD